jgi:hypothetical protein
MRGEKMIYKLLRNFTPVDGLTFLLLLLTLYVAFFTSPNPIGVLYMCSVTMFFFGVGFVVDAIAKIDHNAVIVITSEQGSDKPTIQER